MLYIYSTTIYSRILQKEYRLVFNQLIRTDISPQLATPMQMIAPFSGTLSLVGGRDASEGNVMIDGEPVCDDNWNNLAGVVVCRQLGFRGLKNITVKSRFGRVSDTFGMDDVECSGGESRLTQCQYQTKDNCGAGEGAGVICLTGMVKLTI